MNIELMKRKRKEMNLTQQQLADLCGLSRVSISNFESGKAEPTKDTLKKIADVLGLKPVMLLESYSEIKDLKERIKENDDLMPLVLEFMEIRSFLVIKLLVIEALEVRGYKLRKPNALAFAIRHNYFLRQGISPENIPKLSDEIVENLSTSIKRMIENIFDMKLLAAFGYKNCFLYNENNGTFVEISENELFLIVNNVISSIENVKSLVKKKSKRKESIEDIILSDTIEYLNFFDGNREKTIKYLKRMISDEKGDE